MSNTIRNGKGDIPRPIRNRADYDARFDAIRWPSKHTPHECPRNCQDGHNIGLLDEPAMGVFIKRPHNNCHENDADNV